MTPSIYALHEFKAEDDDEISFKQGDVITVLEKDDEYGDGWWMGRTSDGRVGLFPANFTSSEPLVLSSATRSDDKLATLSRPQRTSTYSFDGLDDYDKLMNDLRQSISLSTSKLASMKKNTTLPPSPQAPHRSIGLNADREEEQWSSVASLWQGKNSQDLEPETRQALSAAQLTDRPLDHLVNQQPPSPLSMNIQSIPSRIDSYHNHNDNSKLIMTTPHSYLDSTVFNDGNRHSKRGVGYRARHPETWTVEESADWIKSIGFPQYSDKLIENEITGHILLSLTLTTLKELDILALGKRMQIMNSINDLKDQLGLPLSTTGLLSPLSTTISHTSPIHNNSPTISPIPHTPCSSNSYNNTTQRVVSTSPSMNQVLNTSTITVTSTLSPYPRREVTTLTIEEMSEQLNHSSTLTDNQTILSSCITSTTGKSDILSTSFIDISKNSFDNPLTIPYSIDIQTCEITDSDCEGYLKTFVDGTHHLSSISGDTSLSQKVNNRMSKIIGHHVFGSGGWKKRFIVLKNNCLYFFKDKHSRALNVITSIHGFKIIAQPSSRSTKHCFKLIEKPGDTTINKITSNIASVSSLQCFLFYTENLNDYKMWFRKLTIGSIAHTDHEASKRRAEDEGIHGVEIIGDPRGIIASIRVGGYNSGQDMLDSELSSNHHRDWNSSHSTNSSPSSLGFSSSSSNNRRPSLPIHAQHHTRSYAPTNTTSSGYGSPSSSRNNFLSKFQSSSLISTNQSGQSSETTLLPSSRSRSTDPYVNHSYQQALEQERHRSEFEADRPRDWSQSRPQSKSPTKRLPISSGGNKSYHSTEMEIGKREGKRLFESSHDRNVQQREARKQALNQHVTFINAYLPPNEHIIAVRDLIPGMTFVHFLSNVARTPVPPHLAKMLRTKPSYRIDWMDNWDAVLIWCRELGVTTESTTSLPSIDELVSGDDSSYMLLIAAVRDRFKPGRAL